MTASKFTAAQKAFIIQQGEDRTPVEDIYRKAGISLATYYAWKKKYADRRPPSLFNRANGLQKGDRPREA